MTTQTKILFVDSGTFHIKLYRLFMRDHMPAEQLEWVQTDEDALKQVKEHSYDAIVVFIAIEETSRVDTIRKIRNQGYDKPIVAISYFPEEEIVQGAKEAGVNGHLFPLPMDDTLADELKKHGVKF